ncbi:PqqD family protein [Shimia aestuarii]|uniref:Coenzyme PQQ synthesis protein D (PqqD) n=1 Tax=Shimia aestuarii TaxID=254406 RepID=A0A1I4KL13_9RHOB|nr:PqqD family protein [Shimia aestuarii]SFL79454.1 Coenzyme PQQ synthesis protein D (PqqD) [Shimia aestuarii]
MKNVGYQNASLCWQAARECSVETNSKGAILTERACGTRHYLNATAAIVYLLCDKCHSTEDIAGFIAEQFSLENLPIDDVQGALDQLQAKGLIQRG